RHLATMPSLPDTLAARALVVYHLAEQRAMMGTFLDGLGIAHENGLIQEESVKPDAAKIGAAVDAVSKPYPAGAVRRYLETLLCQDPDTWAVLADITAAK